MRAPPLAFADNRFVPILAACYVVFWLLLAIRPLDRGDWFLENLLVFVTVAVFVLTYRQFQFSDLGYALIVVFLAVHAVGAHYACAKVPAGFWLEDWLRLHRNHFDRVIHFSFGLLLVFPFQEFLMRSAEVRVGWVAWLAVAGVAALSSFFEIVEALIAQIVRPDLGDGVSWHAGRHLGRAKGHGQRQSLGGVVATVTLGVLRAVRARAAPARRSASIHRREHVILASFQHGTLLCH